MTRLGRNKEKKREAQNMLAVSDYQQATKSGHLYSLVPIKRELIHSALPGNIEVKRYIS